MLSPFNWQIFNFSSSTDFIQTIVAGTIPDIVITNYNIASINLRTVKGEVSVTNSLDLIKILIDSNVLNKVPIIQLLNQQHSITEYQHCNSYGIPYLTKTKFDAFQLTELLQRELRTHYQDSTDYLHILQYGRESVIPSMGNQSFGMQTQIMQSQFDINEQIVNQKNQDSSNVVTKKKGQVISFYNGGKGGVGKTTIATNFSILLATNGARVLLMDADFYAPNCYLLLKVKPARTIIDLKYNLNNLTTEGFNNCIINHAASGLDFLAGPTNPKDVEILNPNDLMRIVDFAKEYYDYIIVDLPPKLISESVLVDAMAQKSDKIVQVTTQTYSSINGIEKAFQALANESISPDKFYICVNKLNPKINFDPDSISSKVAAGKDYSAQLPNGKIPVCGKIGSDDNVEIYESLMEPYIMNSKTKFRKDMEYMVMNLIPDFKLTTPSTNNTTKKEMKSSKSFMSVLSSLFKKKA